MSLFDQAKHVTDRESFFTFVQSLINDRVDEVTKENVHPSSPWGPGANGWENGTIEAFLDAALRWAEASQDREELDGLTRDPSWRSFAMFLFRGKVYE